MTKRDLIEGYYKAQESGSGQWYQRWSTMVDANGLAYIRGELGDPYERYEPLDGLLEHVGELRQLRRWEWYAIRHDGDEWMQLYRFTPGDNQNAEHLNAVPELKLSLTRCCCVFRSLFQTSGGFNLRDSEALAAERAADEVSRLHSKSYR